MKVRYLINWPKGKKKDRHNEGHPIGMQKE